MRVLKKAPHENYTIPHKNYTIPHENYTIPHKNYTTAKAYIFYAFEYKRTKITPFENKRR